MPSILRPSTRLTGALCTLGFVACASFGGEEGSSSSSSGTPNPNGQDGGPVVVATPGSLAVSFASTVRLTQGASAKVHVKVAREGLPGTVTITGKNLPEGVGLVPLELKEGVSEGDLELSASATAKQGDVKGATVIARSEAGKTADSSMNLFVRGAPGALDTTYAKDGSLDLGDAPNGVVKMAASSKYVYWLTGSQLRRIGFDGQPDATYMPATIDGALGVAVNGVDDSAFVYQAGSPNSFAVKIAKTGSLDTAYGTNGTSEALTTLFSVNPGLIAVNAKNEVFVTHAAPGSRHRGNLVRARASGIKDASFTFTPHQSAEPMFGSTDVSAVFPRADGTAIVVTDDDSGPSTLDLLAVDGSTTKTLPLAEPTLVNPVELDGFVYMITFVPDGDRAIIRFDGSLLTKDTTFATAGGAKLPPYPLTGGGDGMGFVFDGQKRIVAACFTTFAGATQLVLSRFMPDGSADKSFAPSGFQTTPSAVSGSLSIFVSDPERVLVVGARGTKAFASRFWM